MLNKFVASLRDVHHSFPIATPEEERWLNNLWHGALHRDNQDAVRRFRRCQWGKLFLSLGVVLACLGLLTWLGGR